jgi:hypothetical protein
MDPAEDASSVPAFARGASRTCWRVTTCPHSAGEQRRVGSSRLRGSRADQRSASELELRRLGFHVVRVSAELVLRDLNAAIKLVRAAL